MAGRRDLVGWDDLAHDLFGFNLLGLKTIWTAIIRPRQLIDDARAPDWRGRALPAPRVYFLLLALVGVLQFVWLGEQSDFRAGFLEGSEESKLGTADAKAARARATYGLAMFSTLLAPVTLLFMSAAVLPFRRWGDRVGKALRWRFGFVVLVPAAATLVVVLVVVGLIAPDHLPWQTLMFVLPLATLIQGLRAGLGPPGKIGRVVSCSLFTLVTTVAGVAASLIALVTGYFVFTVSG